MKLTEKYILECLDKYCTFEGLTEDTFVELVVQPLREANCFEKWVYDNGVTKGVLIFKELDFVVKIPFVGRTSYIESHYERSNGAWTWVDWGKNTHTPEGILRVESSEDGIWEFEGSSAEDSNWNYCQAELEIAARAKDKSLDKCIAVTEFLGFAKDHPIYIQERCCMFDEMSSTTKAEEYRLRTKADYDSLKKVRERTDFWGVNSDWVLDFLIYWGEDMLKKLGDFIYDNDIEDLHDGNIGYRNGVPCLVDYSSFRD